MKQRTDILEQKDLILSWIEQEVPISEMAFRLCCKHETLKRYLVKLGINYAGQQNKKGQHKGTNVYKPSSYYTNEDDPKNIPANILREKLILDGVKEAKCELCGCTDWQGLPVELELHHLDENHSNNRLSNLIILCPNCHAFMHKQNKLKAAGMAK